MAVYREAATSGGQSYFFYRPSSSPGGGLVSIAWGGAGDKSVIADYDGDGKADLAVFRTSEGVWYALGSSSGFTAVRWGMTNDKPAPAAFVR